MRSRRAFVVVLIAFAILLTLQQAFDPAPPPHQYRDPRTVAAKPTSDILEFTAEARGAASVYPTESIATVREPVLPDNKLDFALRGHVVSSRDQPVESAVVTVRWPADPAFPGDQQRQLARVRTDASGAYIIPGGLPRDTVRVLVTAEGFSSDNVLAYFGDTVSHRLAPEGKLIVTTTLRSSGLPISCHVQVVRIVEPRRRFSHGWFVTNAQGSVAITGLPSGAYQVVAHCIEADLRVLNDVAVANGEATSLAIELDVSGVRVHGTVIDRDTAKPVENAELCLNPNFSGMTVRSNAEGQFDMGVYPPGAALQVYARAPNYAMGQAFLEVASQPMSFNLEMTVGHALFGFVRTRTGAPIEGAQIIVKGEVTRGKKRTMHIATDAVATTSGSDGMYRLEHLVPDDMRYEVFVRSPMAAMVNEALEGPLTADVRRDWVLDVGHSLQVKVWVETGPPEGMRIVAFRSDENLKSEARMEVSTNVDGLAVFEGLVSGTYKIRPFPMDGWVGNAVVEVPTSGGVDLHIQKGHVLAGEVRCEDSQPVQACLVAVRNAEGRLWSARFIGSAFSIGGLEGPPYDVTAWLRGEGSSEFGGRVENAIGDDLVVVVPSVGPMEGNVLRMPQQTPVGNVKIVARAAGTKRIISTCSSDEAGNFSMMLPDNTLYDLYVVDTAGEAMLARNRRLRIKQTLLIQ
jgi:hypothetical protein